MSLTPVPSSTAPEFGVYEALQLLWRARWTLIAGLVVGCGLAALALFLKTPQYEATAIVRLAQIGKPGEDGVGIVTPVESQGQAIARFRIPSFLSAAQLVRDLPFDRLVLRVDASAVRGTDAIDIRYRAETPDAAKEGVRKLFELLALRHAELVKPAVEVLQLQLAKAEQLRSESRQRREQILAKLPSMATGGVKDQYPFLDAAFVTQDVQVAKWESSIRSAMVAPNTLPTRLIEAVSVSDRPVNPKPLRYWAGGLIGGGLLGLMMVLLQRAWRRRPVDDDSAR